jgi:bis(5'-nucleosyl)-tetraphosphatase (symmetrical)
MAVYAIGDIQGCYAELLGLLEQIGFDERDDRLWFAGDLVNRGPHSLETLRFVRSLNAVTVLGNHDLHLLASACDPRQRKRKDTLQAILEAPDADELLTWLRHQPLLHHDATLDYTMVHAGLALQWNLATAQACAGEVEAVLRSDRYPEFFSAMYGNEPASWSPALKGWERLRFITNCFTRLRYCDGSGRLALEKKGPPGSQPAHLRPWFDWPQRNSRDLRIVFGHWSTLGAFDAPGIHALDTGCLWGGKLTACRLDTAVPQRFEYDCPGACKPGLKKKTG